MAQDQKSSTAVFVAIALFGVVAVNAGAVVMVFLALSNPTVLGIAAIAVVVFAVFVDILAVRWVIGRRHESR